MAILFTRHVSSPFSHNSRQWRPFLHHKSHKPRPSSTTNTHQLPHDPNISYPILIKESQIRLNSREAAAVDSHTQGSETRSRPEMFTESFISLVARSLPNRRRVLLSSSQGMGCRGKFPWMRSNCLDLTVNLHLITYEACLVRFGGMHKKSI
jgi:hypothetical protein